MEFRFRIDSCLDIQEKNPSFIMFPNVVCVPFCFFLETVGQYKRSTDTLCVILRTAVFEIFTRNTNSNIDTRLLALRMKTL